VIREIVDRAAMADTTVSDPRMEGSGEVEFFGVKLKVNNPRLAALLNSDVTDDVTVVGRRARGVFAADELHATADAPGETADAQLEQKIADAQLSRADVQVLPSDARLPPSDWEPVGALAEHPA
jgi:hypothetical protein